MSNNSPLSMSATTNSEKELTIEPYEPVDFDPLVEMYCGFGSEGHKHGLPPETESEIQAWLNRTNIERSLLVRCDTDLIGHVLFVPDGNGQHELGVFVRPEYRSQPVKSQLVETGIEYAKREDLESIWLIAGANGTGSREIYREQGFVIEQSQEAFGLHKMTISV